MSRYYSMTIAIIGANSEQIKAVKQAAKAVWPFDDWFLDIDNRLTASADASLCGGETEEEFAERLAKAIWAANGDYCQVEVNATYLETLPYESYCFDEEDYGRLAEASGGGTPAKEDTPDGQ